MYIYCKERILKKKKVSVRSILYSRNDKINLIKTSRMHFKFCDLKENFLHSSFTFCWSFNLSYIKLFFFFLVNSLPDGKGWQRDQRNSLRSSLLAFSSENSNISNFFFFAFVLQFYCLYFFPLSGLISAFQLFSF